MKTNDNRNSSEARSLFLSGWRLYSARRLPLRQAGSPAGGPRPLGGSASTRSERMRVSRMVHSISTVMAVETMAPRGVPFSCVFCKEIIPCTSW
jgi:hypothetical protein